MLLLFDIDATLISTGGAGIRAMVDAGRELFGPGFHAQGLEFAGRLDTLITRDMFRVSGVTPDAAMAKAFRERYLHYLRERLASEGQARALPGVLDVLARLEREGGAALGLLTGNFAETGSAKLLACGIDPRRFDIHVWCDDCPHEPPTRDGLPPVGIKRFEEKYGRALEPGLVTIIGDTPHDVRCAKVNGCRVLAVATGSFGVEELRAAGADEVVKDLSSSEAVVRWLMGGA